MEIRRYLLSELPAERLEPLITKSLFASPDFMNLWQVVGGRPVYWVAESKGEIRAVLPGVEFGRGPFKRFQSLPDGCYGRVFFSVDNKADNRAVAKLLMREIGVAGYVRCYLYDFYATLPGNSGFRGDRCQTHIVSLERQDWMPPDKKLQSEIRKAGREGVTIAPFEPLRHMDRFMTLMTAAEEAHGRRPKYPRRFFERLAELAKNDSRVIWWWCEHEGQAVTTHINFLENDMALNWQVYYDRSFSALKANQYLLYELARRMQAAGLKRLNLGASPPEAETLSEYKEKWGGRLHSYKCYWRKSRLGRLL